MKRKFGVAQLVTESDDQQSLRKSAKSKYQAQYRRSHREAAQIMDEYLGITYVGYRLIEPGVAEEPSGRECFTRGEIARMDQSGDFEPVSESRKQSVYKQGVNTFGLPSFRKRVCAVCDALWPANGIRNCDVQGNGARKWVNKLKWLDDVPDAHRREYDVSLWLPQLNGALLSPRGLVRQSNGKPNGLLQVCLSCYKSLNSSSIRPPKFAIANGFDVGRLPAHLGHATWIERQMTSVSSVAASVTVLHGGRHKKLRGHVTVVTLDPGAIARKLPLLLRGKENFFVVLTSTLTPHQKLLAMKKYRARHQVISELLDFYMKNNIVYQSIGVSMDSEALRALKRNEDTGGEPLVFCQEGETTENRGYGNKKADFPIHEKERVSEQETEYVEESFVAVRSDENTTVEILDAAREVLAVRNNGKLVLDFDNDLLALAFPDLFPRGRGHPGTKRPVNFSFEECIRYYLRLPSHQFSQHPSFLFVVFDICGKRRVVTSTTVRSLNPPGEFEKIGNLSRDQVVAAIDAKREERKRLIHGESKDHRRAHASNFPGDRLLRNVIASQCCMWGSTAERLTYRRRGFCMDAYFKSGAIFVTITPSDTSTMIISVLAGKLSVAEVQSMKPGDIPSRSNRVEVAIGDPVACSEYFEAICEGFFEVIVGYDVKRKLPYRGGGLFGVVKAYFGTIETQSSGTLHMHCILYVSGLPRTSEDFKNRCEDALNADSFKEKFKALVDSVVTTSVPAYVSEMDVTCPQCHKNGGVESLKVFPRAAYQMRIASLRPVSTSACRFCGASFGASEVLRHQVRVLHDAVALRGDVEMIPLGKTEKDSDQLAESFLSIPRFLERPSQENNTAKNWLSYHLRLSQIVLLTQKHNSCHVLSCFKKNSVASPGKCRYMFPRSGGQETRIGNHNKLKIGRRFHHEYINAYNDVILPLMCSNHDIRFLVGSGTTDALYYCMKYFTKSPPDIECLDTLALGHFDRRKRAEEEKERAGVPYSSKSSGASRVKSIALAMSKMQQVPATICAVYFRRHSGMISSHDFVSFHLGQTLSIFEKDEFQAVLVAGNEGKMVHSTQLNDYMKRPHFLNAMSMIEFVTSYERVRRKKEERDMINEYEVSAELCCEDNLENLPDRLFFAEEHLLFQTHCLKKRVTQVVPDIIGPRLPDRTELNSKQEQERFGLIAMILVKPFHKTKLITDENMCFWDSFLAFEASKDMTHDRQTYLENFQEYYVSKAEAAKQRAVFGNRDEEICEEPDWAHLDVHRNGNCDIEDDCDGVNPNNRRIPAHVEALKGLASRNNSYNQNVLNSSKTATCLNLVTHVQNQRPQESIGWPGNHIYESMKTHEGEDYSTEIAEARQKKVALAQESNIFECTQSDIPKIPSIEHQREFEGRHANTKVEILRNEKHSNASDGEACKVIEEDGVDQNFPSDGTDTGHFVAPDAVAQRFNLNRLQKVAFKEIVKRLLPRISNTGDDKYRKVRNAPFTMYIGGEGGTGKSRVISAVMYFAKSWKTPGAVRTCAPTGIAATLVHGKTFHSFAKIFGNGRRVRRSKRTSQLIEEFRALHLLFVDEVSMLARKFVGRLDSFLREVKELPDDLFGNVMVVFCGDFFQIPPVGTDSVYEDPESSKYKVSIEDRTGYDIWRNSLDSVVILQENMRQSDDEDYAQLLKRLRYGKLSTRDIGLLNERVLGGNSLHPTQQNLLDPTSDQLSFGENFPLVVRGNELRNKLNWACVKRRSK